MSNASESRPTTPHNRNRRRLLLLLLLTLSAGLIFAIAMLIRAEQGLARAQTFLIRGQCQEAETALDRYLILHPNDPQGILLWAESVIGGTARPPRMAAELAISRLQRIPDSATHGAEARMREGRLALLILHQPDRAEGLLLRSIRQDPKILDSHYLLWKLLDLTERFQYSEPHFWNVYELTPESRKAERLREWYLSQFSPGTANADLDRHMGFLKPDQLPGPETDLVRLEQFYSSEPDSPMVVAALAQWYLRHRERAEALDLLRKVAGVGHAGQNTFYLSTLIATHLDLGQLNEAREVFQRWPKPYDGYLYWSTAGRILDLVERNDQAAIDAYAQALALWPGPAEWSLRHRRAQCLARHGERGGADVERQKARQVEQLMEQQVHQRLRTALANPGHPQTARHMAEFYDTLGRDRESKCWRNIEARLSPPPRNVYSTPRSRAP